MAVTIANLDVSYNMTGTSRSVQWSGMATGDSGSAYEVSPWSLISAQATGTFGGATVAIEGSNDGTNFVTLTKAPGSTAASFTAAGLLQVVEHPRYIRPSVTGGAGSGIAVTLLLSKLPALIN